MRKRKEDAESVKKLSGAYKESEERLYKVIARFSDGGPPKEILGTLNVALRAEVVVLRAENKQFAKSLPNGKSDSEWGAQLIDIRHNTYIELNRGMENAYANLRGAVKKALKDTGEGRNLYEYAHAIQKTLQDNGLANVRYANGAKVGLKSYAEMLARSSKAETDNIGRFKDCEDLETDLVECTTISPTCALCATYQGRVYSISGKDKRFPALFKTALSRGYMLLHPNCRHEFLPYIERFRTQEEVAQAIERSNRPFTDSREKTERDRYAEWQAFNRQMIREEREYEVLKRELGDDMPYKTLGGFRNARRKFESDVKAGKLDKNAAADYNTYAKAKRAVADKKLQADIIANRVKTIEEGKQGKHVPGHNNYIEGRSYLTISLEEAQTLVDRYAGHGKIQRTTSDKWKHKEEIVVEKCIGVCICISGNEVKTNKFMIHYSKNGTHIVPTLQEEDR